MRVILIADTYVPARISGAVQMHDLAREFLRQGHSTTVLTPDAGLSSGWQVDHVDGVRVLRVRAPATKDIGLVRRALAECWLPFALMRGFSKSTLSTERFDGVVWYSPTIFLGPVARMLKRHFGCRGYLIVRDLFPDWAVDAGAMRKGLAYRFFKAVERFQYRVADVIGVQTPANVQLVARDARGNARIEVLHNWLSAAASAPQSTASFGLIEGRTVFVYAGNMGVAQDIDAFLDLAKKMDCREDVGFLFVGRGSEVPRLKLLAISGKLNNVVFLDEIDSALVPSLLGRCHVGIVALHPSHTTHNIPGKFVAYLRAGLPVLARINRGNDLKDLIGDHGVGLAVVGASIDDLFECATRLAEDGVERSRMAVAGKALAERVFSPATAVQQIVAALQ